jgi:hypothetical protein
MLPVLCIGALGVYDQLAPRPLGSALVLRAGLALAVISVGAALFALRKARLDALIGLIVVAGAAALAGGFAALGSRARDDARLRANRVQSAAKQAMTDHAGWYGGAPVGRARIFALEVAAASEFAEILAQQFSMPATFVVLGIDNRAGTEPLVLDAGDVYVQYLDGHVEPALNRQSMLAGWRGMRSDVKFHSAPYVVEPGAAMNNALAFLPAGAHLENAAAILVKINGAPVVVRGRWLSLAEKQRPQN